MCRQRIAARTTSTVSGVGITSVFVHGVTWAALALAFFGLAADAVAFALALALALIAPGRLSPSAIVAVTGFFLLAVVGLRAGSGDEQAGRDGGDGKNAVQELVRSHGGDLRVDRVGVGSVRFFVDPTCPSVARILRQPG